MATLSVCAIPGCGKSGKIVRGWCAKHYARWLVHGDPNRYIRAAAGEAIAEVYKVQATDHDECVIWPFSRKGDGYGRIIWDDTMMTPSRAACIVAYGPPPSPTHQVAHSCGRGAQGCFNPRHLRWATPKNNVADRYRHGTVAFGPDNPGAKLTWDQARQIKNLLWLGVSDRVCAEHFKISTPIVYRIRTGRAYRNV